LTVANRKPNEHIAPVIDLLERAAIRAESGCATPAELRMLEQHARDYKPAACWRDLGTARTKLDMLRVCSGLGLHVHELAGIVEPASAAHPFGVCTCGSDKKNSNGKHPIPNRWQTLPFDMERVERALIREPRLNLGWRMGQQPSGDTIICFDVDGPRSLLDPLEAKFGKLPETLTASSGKGLHLFFRLAETSTVPKNTKLCGIKEIDIRSTGGQVVIAPSTHYSGREYQWVNCIEPAELDL
jgi:hypothetical protein